MNFKAKAVLAALMVVFAATPAFSQSTGSGDYHSGHQVRVVRHGIYTAPFWGYNAPRYGYYPWLRPSGYEVAAVVRARGEANLLNANARTQNAVAYKKELENNLQTLATRLERRRVNSEYRFGHLHAQADMRREQAQIAKSKPSESIHPMTGEIDWPLILKTSHYAKARQPVDQVFEDRAMTGQINPELYGPMCNWIEKIQAEVKKNASQYEANDRVAAQKFLRHLIVEAGKDAPTPNVEVQLASLTK